ncbi:MAG: hypothetical protein IT462_14960 [Planctomycetes bacterium]|nr:hypothetical protein [Planctomycetota bacterium]
MNKIALVIVCLCFAGVLNAQGAATPAKESFAIEPASLATNAQNASLRLVSTAPSGFATNSSKQPEISFSAGVTLVAGSFKLLNSNEAECKVNVAADAFGAVEVSVALFSVNGTKTLSTLKGTLGILGPSTVQGTSISVSVESVPLVQANIALPQAGGVIVLTGPVNGALRIAAPTGARFVAAPTPTTTAGTITGATLANGNVVFNFTVDNATAQNVTVRLTAISYDLSLYSQTGGQAGSLAVEASGAAMSNKSALVINAHTALSTLEGENDNPDVTPPADPPPPNTTSNPPAPASGGDEPAATTGTGLRNNDRTSRQPGDRTSSTSPRYNPTGPSSGGTSSGTGTPPAAPPNLPPAPMPAPPPNYGRPPASRPTPAGGETPSGSVSGGGATSRPATDKEVADHVTPKAKEETKPNLFTTPGLYFCDKDFNPIGAVVLSSTVGDKASARVWLVLKAKKDKNPEAIDSVEVKLKVSGTTRTIKLTETGKNTGEFRCAKDGIVLVSDEEPESVIEEQEAPVAPKARINPTQPR